MCKDFFKMLLVIGLVWAINWFYFLGASSLTIDEWLDCVGARCVAKVTVCGC